MQKHLKKSEYLITDKGLSDIEIEENLIVKR